jgi:THAP4-like, heme-binding beta-barrel domain
MRVHCVSHSASATVTTVSFPPRGLGSRSTALRIVIAMHANVERLQKLLGACACWAGLEFASEVGPLLAGVWRGEGHGQYPTIKAFAYGEEITFTHPNPAKVRSPLSASTGLGASPAS